MYVECPCICKDIKTTSHRHEIFSQRRITNFIAVTFIKTCCYQLKLQFPILGIKKTKCLNVVRYTFSKDLFSLQLRKTRERKEASESGLPDGMYILIWVYFEENIVIF
jgi:hypothetical protein